MITLSNSPLGEDAGAMASVPAPPKFRVGEAPERNASAMVVLMVYTTASPAKGRANSMPQVAAINKLRVVFMVFDSRLVLYSWLGGCHRKKERPRPIGLAPKFEQEILHRVGKQEVGQGACAGI